MTGLYTKAPAGGSQQFSSTPPAPQDSGRGRQAAGRSSQGENRYFARNPNSNSQNPSNSKGRESGPERSAASSSTGFENIVEAPLLGKDDDDLEIIEEFNSITNSHSQPTRRNIVLQKDKTDKEQLNDAVKGGSKALPDSVSVAPIQIKINVEKPNNNKEREIERTEKSTQGSGTTIDTPEEWIEERRNVKRSRAMANLESAWPKTPAEVSVPRAKETGYASTSKKPKKEISVVQESNCTFADFGGSEKVLEVSTSDI